MKTASRWLAPLVLAPLAALALARLTMHDALLPLIWANSLTAWVYLPAWPALAYAVYRDRPALGGVAAALVVCHVFWVAPALVGGPAPARDTPALRVVTANLLVGNAEVPALARELAGLDADLLVIEELSPDGLRALEATGILTRYPHHALEVRDDAFGIGLFARHPLVRAQVVDLEEVPMIDAELLAHGQRVRVIGVHTLPPVSPRYAAVWRAQLARLAAIAAVSDGPLVIAGDLNATRHAAGMAALRRAGLTDAHDALGRGLTTTWPNGRRALPGLHLDHVLVRGALAPIAVREGIGAGSDHRPVIVDLSLVGARAAFADSAPLAPRAARSTLALPSPPGS